MDGWDSSNQGGAPPADNSWNQGSTDNNSWNQGSGERERSPRRQWNDQGDNSGNSGNGGNWNNDWKKDNNNGSDWKKDDNNGGDWKNNDSGGSWSKKDWGGGGGGGWNKDDKWGDKEDKREICRFFAKTGWCRAGDDCKHKHVEGGGEKKGKMMAGDWECPGCGFENFARNKKCKKCGTERPGLTAEEAGQDDAETKKKDNLVRAIKKYQRIDDDNTENWYWFCDVNRFRDKYDPGRKPIEFLEDFVTAMKVPEWEENGDSGKGGKGDRGKGGGGSLPNPGTAPLTLPVPDMASLLNPANLSNMSNMMSMMQQAMSSMSMPAGMPALPGGMPALPGGMPLLPGLPGMPTMPGTMPAGMPQLPFMPS